MDELQIVVLTKSAKHHNYCVSGINLRTKKLVRLVSQDESTMYALTPEMVIYKTGKECEILDIVRVRVKENVPLQIQKENVLIDEDYYFEYIGKMDLENIKQYVTTKGIVFGNTNTYIGKETALQFGYSLGLYEVSNVILTDRTNNQGRNTKKVSFVFDGRYYEDWSMTDYAFYNISSKIADKAYIVVSIPEDDYNGNYYKFVAQIFVL